MNDLTERLAREADEFERRGGGALHLDQVLDRAGEIRRARRLRATLVMAACVLAIAVPTVLVASDQGSSGPPTPARQVKKDLSPLQLAGLEPGAPPRTGYAVDDTWHADGTSVHLARAGTVRAVVPLGSRFLVETDAGRGDLRVAVVPAPPAFVGEKASWPVEGGLAASADGSLAAFVQPDGTPVVVQDEGQVSVDLPRIEGSGFDAVALTGTDCKSPSDSVCAVWVTTNGRKPASWVSTPEGVTRVQAAPGGTDAAAGRWRLSDVLDDGMQAGMTDVSDSGSCSAVRSGAGTAVWSTCEYRLLSFSPDGHHLLASSAYADGAGDSRLAVLDAASGKPVLDVRTAQDAFVGQVVWEDDTHVLAAVAEAGRWAVVRIGLDGHREYAVEPVTSKDPYLSPFRLPSR
jgi:hypothetical protein